MQRVTVLLLSLWGISSCSAASFKSYAEGNNSQLAGADADAAAAEGSRGSSEDATVGGDGVGDGQMADSGEPAPKPSTEDVIKIKDQCKAMADKIQIMSQTIEYPERAGCSFGKAPNLAAKDAFFQAREISPATLDLPDGIVCNLSIDSGAKAKFHYDDFLVFTISDHVLFSTNGLLTGFLPKDKEVYTWDFAKVVGKPIEDFEAKRYCIGKAEDCVLPPHDKKGNLLLKLESEEIAPIAAAIEGKQKVSLDLVALGDNDHADCFHKELKLKVDIMYLPR